MKNRKHNLTNLDNVIIVHLDKDEILIVEKK